MKRKHLVLLGKGFMLFGLLKMVVSFIVILLSYMPIPELQVSDAVAQAALGLLFIGALVWLTGAKLSGRERIEDRYWYLRRRYKSQHRHRHP